MAKFGLKLLDRIVTLIEEGEYTISEICNLLGLSRNTFYRWKDSKPEFSKAIDSAIERRDETLFAIACKSLKRKLEGYTTYETQITYAPDSDNPGAWVAEKRVEKESEKNQT